MSHGSKLSRCLAICKWARCSDAFVTFTCNPQWPEIKRALLLDQQPQDRPDLVTRMFKIKLKELINDIHKKHILGRTIAKIYVIEFQKRGLLHAHILIFFVEDYKPHTVEDVDRMINAELLNLETNRLAHETVSKCMMHGPCGAAFPNAPCMEDGKCTKQYPRKTMTNVNGYLIYRRKNTKCTILVHGVELDNHWVVLHNVYLSTKYDVHINVEVCNNIRVVKYMFKYVYKGHDLTIVEIPCHNDNATKGMWSKPMKFLNILIVAMYLHRKQLGTSSSLICMSSFLPSAIPFAQSTNGVVR